MQKIEDILKDLLIKSVDRIEKAEKYFKTASLDEVDRLYPTFLEIIEECNKINLCIATLEGYKCTGRLVVKNEKDS